MLGSALLDFSQERKRSNKAQFDSMGDDGPLNRSTEVRSPKGLNMDDDVGCTFEGEISHQFISSWSLPTHPFYRSVSLSSGLFTHEN